MSKRQQLRVKIYRAMIYISAVFLVLLAITFSLARVILHDLGKYRDVVEQQVSQLLNQKVHIQGFDARLEGITPVLIFKEVELLHSKTNKELARFAEARVGLAVLASLRELQLVPGEITVNGIHIVLTRHKSGSLSIQGLKVRQIEGAEQTAGDAQLAQWLFTYSNLSLENSSIVWQDNLARKRYDFSDVNLHLRNSAKRHVLSGQMEVPRTLGREVKFSADIEGDSLNPKDWQGKFFLQAFSVDLKQWEQFEPKWNKASLKSGQLDVRLWGAWRQNHLTELSGDISLYDLILQEKNSEPVELKLVAGLFDWQRNERDWAIKLNDFQLIHQSSIWPKTDISVVYRKGNEDTYQIAADYIRIEDLHQLVSALGEGTDELRQALQQMKPSGDIRQLQANLNFKENKLSDFVVRSHFKNLNIEAWQSYPAIQGFQGSLVSTLNYGELQIENRFSTLYFPKLFRRAFSLHQFNTKLAWSRGQYGWAVSASDIQAQTAEVKADANLYLHIPVNKASPYMDFQVQFWDGDVSQASTYYPVGIMSKGLVQWLDQSIVSGNVSFGGAVFSGRLRDFPFRQRQGNFQVQFYADNVELDYQANWPHLTNAKIDASFADDGMVINGLQAQLFKQTVSNQLDVTIKDFRKPELQVYTKTSGPTKEVFDFLVNSPIASEAREFVESVEITGSSDLELSLYVPLSKQVADLKPLHYRGNVKLQQSHFMLLNKAVDIRSVNGMLNFDERGLTSKGIKARIFGEASTLDVYTQDFKEARPIQIVGQGELDTSILASRFDIPGLENLSGRTSWQGAFTLPYKQQQKYIPATLKLSSDLSGVNIGLPVPLDKKPETEKDFSMVVEFPKKALTKMTLGYAEQVQAVLGIRQSAGKTRVVKAAVNFGEDIPGLPDAKHLELHGTLMELPVQSWVKVFAAKNNRGNEGYDWQQMPIALAMERLHLQVADTGDNKGSNRPLNVLPQQWPALNGYINHLGVNDTEIGKIELNTERERYGFNINKLDLTTPYSKITATGDWYFRRQQETRLKLGMSSTDLGAQLSQWGFAAIIKGGKVDNSQMQASWNDSPFGFEFVKLKGTLNAHIKDGNITEVDTGAGRLFGLLSLSALPRRLFLDFADLKSGFAFDTVQGAFDMSNGNATTKNLVVDGTLAKIIVDGRTGLSQQDYDLNVLVIPNISGTAPLPGYLVWGPQVGAVLLFFKQLFGKEFDKSVASRYRVTGPWDKPLIEKVVIPTTE